MLKFGPGVEEEASMGMVVAAHIGQAGKEAHRTAGQTLVAPYA